MQTGRDRAKPQCYRPLDEPGGLPCLLLFISLGSNRLRRMTAMPNSGTEPSMAKASWPVQNAFYGRIGHATTESSPTPAAKRLSPTRRASALLDRFGLGLGPNSPVCQPQVCFPGPFQRLVHEVFQGMADPYRSSEAEAAERVF